MNSYPLPRVVSIPILNVKVFLIQSLRGYTLIDTGIPFHTRQINRALQTLDIELGDIQTIILTHGHLDHIGCLAYLKSRSGAAVICHRTVGSILEGGGYEKAVPRVFGWKLLNPIVSALLGKGLTPVHPDQILDESLDLGEFGLNGRVLHTPGHSPGSCSIILDCGVCFIGDLLRERSPAFFDTGLFYHDRDQILTSLRKVAALGPETIYLSHGTTMSGYDLEKFLSRT